MATRVICDRCDEIEDMPAKAVYKIRLKWKAGITTGTERSWDICDALEHIRWGIDAAFLGIAEIGIATSLDIPPITEKRDRKFHSIEITEV